MLIPFLFCFQVFCPFLSQAHEGERLYAIPELSMGDLAIIDVKDGAIEDWIEAVGEPALTALDFFSDRSYDPSDFDFQTWMEWNAETGHIYCALAVVDDDYFNGILSDVL